MTPTSLYIHIPFCSHKCLFCSFNIAVGQTHKADEYLKRLQLQAQDYQGLCLDTVYIGGGTPSLLSCHQIEQLMSMVRKNFYLNDNCEISFEANPEDITTEKTHVLKTVGINRISLGVQSLNDKYLKFLGRRHDALQAKKAFEILRTGGFENINLDLMCAFPSQSDEELQNDVKEIALLKSEHLSVYTLTIESQSRFYTTGLKLDEEEKVAKHYLMVCQILKDHGFIQYEVSNFAKKDFESIHNKNYWLGKRYVGLGMGAHGFVGRRRYWNTDKLQSFLTHKDMMAGFEDLDEKTMDIEKVLFGLRMNEGIEWALLPKEKEPLVNQLIQDGFLVLESGRLKVTDKGRLVLDELSVRLI